MDYKKINGIEYSEDMKSVIGYDTKEMKPNKDGIIEIKIEEGVEEINSEAFLDLRPPATFDIDLTLPSSLKKIGRNAFSRAHLKNVYFNEGLEKLGPYSMSKLTAGKIHLPKSLKVIEYGAFNNTNTETIDLKNVEVIKEEAFSFSKIKKIKIPKSVKVIKMPLGFVKV